MKVSGIIEDANINKGVIVSKSGFTQDGIDYAKYRNIGLVELREIEETDLEGKPTTFDVGVLKLQIKSVLHRPQILHIETDAVENIQIVKESWKNTDIIRLSNGKQVSFTDYIREFQDELHLQKKIWQTITKRYEIPGGRFINKQTNFSIHINAITFTGVLKKIDKSSTVEFTLVDQVWLIMKLLFENKTFTFSENGIIIENKSN